MIRRFLIYRLLLMVALLIVIQMVAYAGESVRKQSAAVKSPYILGTTLSTTGPGLSIAYAPSESVFFSLGVDYLSLTYPFAFEENSIDYEADLLLQTGNISLLAGYYWFRSLYVSAGAGYSLFSPSVDGRAVGQWKYGDIYIPAEDIGVFLFRIEPSWRLTPYLGTGIDRKLPKKGRVSMNFEIGAYYLGPPRITVEATGLLSPTADDAHQHTSHLESHFSSWRFYPIIRTGLSILLGK